MKLWEVFLYEFNYMFRQERKIALILLGLPLIFSLLFGFVYQSNVVKYVPTVIYDQDQSTASRQLVQAFADSERYEVVGQVTTQEEMEEYLRNNRALASVTIPSHFSRDIKLGISSQVLVQVNGANLMFANGVISTSQELVQTFSAGTAVRLIEATGQLPGEAKQKAAPIRMGIRIINNPTFSYSNFILAGMGINGVQLAIMLAICGVFVRDRSNRTFSAPLLTVGKLLPYWLGGFLAYGLSLLITIGFFQVPVRGDLFSLLILGGAFSFAVVGVGALYSALAPDEVYAIQLPMLYIMPSFLYSGYSWPHMAMGDFASTLSALMPITYAADSLRDSLLAGYSPALYKNSFILVVFGLVLSGIAALLFHYQRRKLERRPSHDLVEHC